MSNITKHDLESRVADLRKHRGRENLPTAGIITILSNEANGGSFEWVDRERRIALIDGQRYRVGDLTLGVSDA